MDTDRIESVPRTWDDAVALYAGHVVDRHDRKLISVIALVVLLGASLALFLMALAQAYFLAPAGTQVSYSDFKAAVRGGRVAEGSQSRQGRPADAERAERGPARGEAAEHVGAGALDGGAHLLAQQVQPAREAAVAAASVPEPDARAGAGRRRA